MLHLVAQGNRLLHNKRRLGEPFPERGRQMSKEHAAEVPLDRAEHREEVAEDEEAAMLEEGVLHRTRNPRSIDTVEWNV